MALIKNPAKKMVDLIEFFSWKIIGYELNFISVLEGYLSKLYWQVGT